MQLPEKRWFRIHEIAQRWSIPPSDIEDYALDEVLQLAVFVANLPAETGSWEPCGDGAFPLVEGLPLLNGPQPLRHDSLLAIFRDGQALVSAFHTGNPDTYLHVAERAQPVIARRDDLIITREERDRFEQEHGSKPDPTGAWHNVDFSSIRIDDEWHSLGPKQAAVIRNLKAASETSEPWCDGKRLLADSGSSLLRLVDLFKRKAAWRHLVTSDGKGRYRLHENFVSRGKQRIRVFRKANRMPMKPVKAPELEAINSP